jgi:predicted metal-dependent peptidase
LVTPYKGKMMTNIVLVPPSNMPSEPPPTYKVGEVKPSEAVKLKQAFEKIMVNDPRCTGLARYIVNVRIFWSYDIPTACAGHGFIFFNPKFYDSIPEQTRITVCVHEVWHLILKHLERGKNCDPYIHNEAADHVINLGLKSDGFTFDGTTPCIDIRYAGMSTETVYNIIYKSANKSKKLNTESMNNTISAEVIEDLIEKVLQAEGGNLEDQKEKAEKDVNSVSKKAGVSTSGKGIKLDLTTNTVMIVGATYQEIFKDYLTDPLSNGKRTFARPNRRQHGLGKTKFILPGRLQRKSVSNRLTHLTYALDVSGSINKKQSQQSHDAIRTIKELLNPTSMTVLYFDTRIKMEKTFTDKQEYGDILVRAGGGTDLKDVYRRTRELESEALVIFTDLCVTIPPKPEWECIWLVPETRFTIPTNIYGNVYLIPQKQ